MATQSRHDTGSGSGRSPEALLAEYLQEAAPAAAARLSWTATSAGVKSGLNQFLDSNLPSKTKSVGNESFIYVCSGRRSEPKAQEQLTMKNALAEAQAEMLQLQTAYETIDHDDRIPLRQSKAKGRSKAQRKKALTDRLGAEVLPSLAQEGGLDGGKWLFFKDEAYVDGTFRALAHSIVDGPLSKTRANVHTVKVSCCDRLRDGKEYLIALHFDDIWSAETAREVAETVIRHHSQFSRACKTDLYSVLEIDSKHWSGLSSSLYNLNTLVPQDVQKELKEAYQEDKALRNSKSRSPEQSRWPTGQQKPVSPSTFWPDEAVDDIPEVRRTETHDDSTIPRESLDNNAQNATEPAVQEASSAAAGFEAVSVGAQDSETESENEDETAAVSTTHARANQTNVQVSPIKRPGPKDVPVATRPTSAEGMAKYKQARARNNGF
ncbi:unnamed protein product [Parajaminaea phylloscopi]